MIKAHAKLNLLLNIRSKKGNFHEIESINTDLELHDEIIIEDADQLSIEFVSSDNFNAALPALERNLCYQACKLFGIYRVKIKIKKNIPVGGLGGGSSDFAVVLTELNKKFKLNFSPSHLNHMASTISKDSCFSLIGGTALVSGFGETVTALKNVPKLFVLLILPDFSIPNKTRYIYSKVNLAEISHPELEGMLTGIENQDKDQILSALKNSFDSVEIPEYRKIKALQYLLTKRGFRVILAGSGPILACISNNIGPLKKLQSEINYRTVLTETK